MVRYVESLFAGEGSSQSGLVLVLVRWRDGKSRGRTDDRLGLKAANRAVAELKPDDDDDDDAGLFN